MAFLTQVELEDGSKILDISGDAGDVILLQTVPSDSLLEMDM